MFDLDRWQEIGATIRANKLRTFMTMAGVFWGIVMLVVMLGFGDGLERGVSRVMGGFATNSVYLWGQRTSQPYQGLQPGRRLRFTNADIVAIQQKVPELEYLSPRVQLGGWRSPENVSRGGKTGAFSVSADYPEYQYIRPPVFELGRFINDRDIKQKRKVTVIGRGVYDQLFLPEEDPIGKLIKVQGVYFQVVGVFRSRMSGERAERDNDTLHIPFTTYQSAFNDPYVGWFAMTAQPQFPASVIEEKVRALLSERHKVAPDDAQAIGSFNSQKEFGKISGLFLGISGLIWFVGIVTLLAGVIGVSNIMLIVVKERTKEIGVRKALGATPWSIVVQLVQESTLLTASAGYVGLVVGIALLELSGYIIPKDSQFLANPSIHLNVGLIATAILIVAGAVAGFLPARAAAQIHPVEALRAD